MRARRYCTCEPASELPLAVFSILGGMMADREIAALYAAYIRRDAIRDDFDLLVH